MASSIGTSGALSLLYILASSVVLAVPSPQSIGSSLSILTHNDLYGNTSTRQAAVLVVNEPKSESEGQLACLALGEALWDPLPAGNNSANVDFLRYLDYGKVTDDPRRYRIAKSNGTCRIITTHGRVQNEACSTLLPALCSQSAALSTLASADNVTRWQTAVTTRQTKVLGYRDKLSFRFLGIRYAKRPVRFEHTKYETPAPGNISALSYGQTCIQSDGCTSANCSEDCHFLNIWTPYLPESKNETALKLKPVMVWIHGGGFTSGTGSDPTFDGGNMASRGDVVAVTINYRLSTFGFMAIENSTITGNYGIVDQLTALEWVRNHIEDFGGDPNRITIWGQSAGAASVRALLAIMSSRPDIPRVAGAIMMSNPNGLQHAGDFSHYYSIAEASKLNEAVANVTGCYSPDKALEAQCLRAAQPSSLISLGASASNPVIDGTYIKTDLPLNSSAKPLDIPILAGFMRDDGAPFSRLLPTTNVSQALDQLSFNSSQIIASHQFPTPHGGNATINVFNVTSRVTTDGEFRCLGQAMVAAAVKNGVFPKVFEYETHRSYQILEWSPNPPTCLAPATPEHPNGDPSQEYFKCHSGDLYYTFGTLIRQGRPPRDELDIPFSQYLVDAWTAFGRSQDPNPDSAFLSARGYSNTTRTIDRAGRWKASTAQKPLVRILDTSVRDVGYQELKQCDVLGLPLDYYSQ